MTRKKITVEFFAEEGGGGPLWPHGDPGTDGHNLGLSDPLCTALRDYANRWGNAPERLSDEERALRDQERDALVKQVKAQLPSRYQLIVV